MLSSAAVHSRRTELTGTKLTQLHDALLVTRASVTKLIGCRASVRTLQFVNCSSAQFISSAVNTALVCGGHSTNCQSSRVIVARHSRH